MSAVKNLQLLLVEDDAEEQRLLCEALGEIEENPQWSSWRTLSVVPVEQLAHALDCLRRDRFDVVLLNLSLPDSPALLNSFLRVNAGAGGTPVVVLVDEEDASLAQRLLREGAQDVLVKSELECKSLARCLRHSIDRQQRACALQEAPFLDHLTGTLTRQGFLTIAGYYARLPCYSRQALVVASLDIGEISEKTPEDREAAHLVLLRAAEALRDSFDSPALVGRVGPGRFALMTTGLAETTVEALLDRVAAGLQAAPAGADRSRATVRFWVAELEGETSPEDLLGEDGEQLAARPAGI